ncbi:MAG: adenine phosphoribosyltransferase [Candidatus Aenigmarchaeota archaeon]|nr:adenine phosphoribosyltransferase [Candidatus Aenigmarchaeota archaeon]
MDIETLKGEVRTIPDWPKPGVSFKDITTLLRDPAAFKFAVEEMANRFRDKKIEAVVSAEARGFIIGAALAYELGVAFVPVRKKGKLPYETICASYSKEYGEDTLHMHKDGVLKGERVLLVDDLLATGGTMAASIDLVKQLGGSIAGVCFLIELNYLRGRDRLKGFDVFSLMRYDE